MNIIKQEITKPVYLLRNGRSRVKILTKGAYMDWWLGKGKEKRAVLFNDNADPLHCTHPCAPIYGALSTDPDIKNNMQYYFGKDHIIPPHGFLRNTQLAFINRADKKLEGPNASVIMKTENIPGKFDHEHIYIRQYPYFFRFNMAITLINENSLKYQLSFTNMDCSEHPKSAPLDMASQIYFHWEKGMKISGLDGLTYHDETDWEKRTDKVFSGDDFGDKMARDWHFCGIGERNIFTISYPDERKIHVIFRTASDIIPQKAVVWTDPNRGNFLGFTPVLRGRNSFNSKNPMMVKPGETFWLSYILQAEGF
jgi:Aldose 1-epimerase